MNGIYPYDSPIILEDDIFTSYGGHTGTSTPNQRKASYLIAEKQMTGHIGTFLLPTVITGSYPYPNYGKPLVLEHSYVNSVLDVKSVSAGCDCNLMTYDGCAIMYENTYGIIFIYQASSYCGCLGHNPFSVQVVYNAGISSGSSYQPDMLLALTMAAEINLNEILNENANEGVGDIGIQKFSNQSYTEERVKLGRNAFGSSARAQKIKNLAQSYVRRKILSVG